MKTVPVVPVATAATGVGSSSFTANWNAFSGANYYLLDVSLNSSFSSFVGSYQNYVVLSTSQVVSGLTSNTTYYYRVRASTDPIPITATGGTITYSGGRTIHTFTSSGTFTVLTAPVGATVEALVVAGGGGGGNFAGGGGGAGGLLYDATKSISVTAYTITIGSGGGFAPIYSQQGTNGNNSVFDTLIAIGGGAGGYQFGGGLSGGSGGGGSAFSLAGGAGTTGQGFAGGDATGGGGGGGGANQTGSNSTTGNGGNGSSYAISGSSIYYAGGGGAAISGSSGGTGGLGGGGNSTGSVGSNATANSGGGGGAVWFNGANTSGNGGSGIVIISYPT